MYLAVSEDSDLFVGEGSFHAVRVVAETVVVLVDTVGCIFGLRGLSLRLNLGLRLRLKASATLKVLRVKGL